jgi:hypothetical protein
MGKRIIIGLATLGTAAVAAAIALAGAAAHVAAMVPYIYHYG